MTGRELIKWILDNKAEDLKFEVQYRDAGGEYPGTDERLLLSLDNARDNTGWCYERVLL